MRAENIVKELQYQGINIAILRFSNVYGGMMDHSNRVVPAFCIAALKNSSINIEGGDCIFDFTYIHDVIDGIFFTAKYLEENKQSLPEIHLINSEPNSLDELAKIILDHTKSKSPIRYVKSRSFDVKEFYGDFSRAKEILGWSPKYSLRNGVHKFINDIETSNKVPPSNISMVAYEDIKSYSWVPSLL